MKKIYVVYDNTNYTFRWLSALIWAKKELKNRGIRFVFEKPFFGLFKKPNPSAWRSFVAKADYVAVAIHPSDELIKSGKELASFLKWCREQNKRIVWFDTSDSAGTTNFEYFKYVDLYLKKQVYRDLGNYRKDIYNARLFCDYYHRKHNINDENVSVVVKPDETIDLTKIGLSWNVGLGNLFDRSRFAFWKNLFYQKRNIKPGRISKDKNIDVHFRGSLWPTTAGYQRRLCVDLINSLQYIHPDPTGKVPQKEYRKELMDSKVVVSPFGWGEICTRDFEAFAYGAVLAKPDMSHLDTWPPFYEPSETYISFDWDFENAKQELARILENNDEYERVAREAQSRYMEYLGSNGKKLFAEHLSNVLLESLKKGE